MKLNGENNCRSPFLSTDLAQNSIVKKGDHRKAEYKKKNNFKLYADGIHPDNLLAKTWLKKLEVQVSLYRSPDINSLQISV